MALVFEPLTKRHQRDAFTCGVPELDEYLKKRARQDVSRRVAAAFVLADEETANIVGYYTLSSLSIRLDELPDEIRAKLPKYPDVPAALLGRLAVDLCYRGQGHGEILLFNALKRALTQSQNVASHSVVVDAKDEDAENFYERYGFIRFPSSPGRMFIPMGTVAKMFA